MLIKCPNCGQSCELDEEPAIGQHLLCPFCESKFSYSGGEASEGIKSPNSSKNDQTIECACPHCGSVYDARKDDIGEPAKCEICSEAFIVKELKSDKLPEDTLGALPAGLKSVAKEFATSGVGNKKKSSSITFSKKNRLQKNYRIQIFFRKILKNHLQKI